MRGIARDLRYDLLVAFVAIAGEKSALDATIFPAVLALLS